MEKELFDNLKIQFSNFDNNIIAEKYPNFNYHKIGTDSSLQPLVLIYSDNLHTYRAAPRKLEMIDIAFNQLCIVNEISNGSIEGRYTILKLKSDNDDLQVYFFKICSLLLSVLGDIPNIEKVHHEVVKIIKLFSSFKSPPKKTIQGLFAELIIIHESSDPDKIIEAWHPNINDLDDFNDGRCSLEIKSTSETGRIHSFSHNQLIDKDDYSFVASVLIKYSGGGINLLQLAGKIELRLVSIRNKIKLNELISSILGKDYFRVSETIFDYNYSASSVRFFKTNEISHIKPNAIPEDVSKLKYCVDFSNKEGNSSLVKIGFFIFINL